jgi:hypothetical protein
MKCRAASFDNPADERRHAVPYVGPVQIRFVNRHLLHRRSRDWRSVLVAYSGVIGIRLHERLEPNAIRHAYAESRMMEH